MAEAKTKPTTQRVSAYLDAIADPERRADCAALSALLADVTGHPPVMWGTAIVGFGTYHYKYASGREGDSCLTGFSSRKADISIYTQVGFEGRDDLLATLGKHKASGSCLHVKRLADIDQHVLRKIIKATVADVKRRAAPK